MVEQLKKDFAGWWLWILMLLVIAFAVLALTGSIGRVFGLAVEREALVHSHQYAEARSSEIVTFEAQLAGLQTQLDNPDLSDNQKAQIKSQIATINVLLDAARSR